MIKILYITVLKNKSVNKIKRIKRANVSTGNECNDNYIESTRRKILCKNISRTKTALYKRKRLGVTAGNKQCHVTVVGKCLMKCHLLNILPT